MAETTVLVLSGIGVPEYSVRGSVKQTLEPISMLTGDDMIWRTVNGELISTVPEQMLKYRSEISAEDVDPPAFDGLWPGQEITVDCIKELGFAAGGTPGRPVVPDSARLVGDFTFYRPQLIMKVREWNMQRNEYADTVSWSLTLEEV